MKPSMRGSMENSMRHSMKSSMKNSKKNNTKNSTKRRAALAMSTMLTAISIFGNGVPALALETENLIMETEMPAEVFSSADSLTENTLSENTEPITETCTEPLPASITDEWTEPATQPSEDPEIAQTTDPFASEQTEEELILDAEIPENGDAVLSDADVLLESASHTIDAGADDIVAVFDETCFPDQNFLDYVKQFDTNEDGNLSRAESDAVEEIYVSYDGISSLKGIEFFQALTHLYCRDNDLVQLNLEQNLNLTELHCDSNELVDLDVSQNLSLVDLDCAYNNLVKLDVTQNKHLENLECQGNALRELNVSQNADLGMLDCSHNQLTKLTIHPNAHPMLSLDKQTRAVSVTWTGTEWQLDMAQLVGNEELNRVRFISKIPPMGENGIVSFPKDELPSVIGYWYDCAEIPKFDLQSSMTFTVSLILETGEAHADEGIVADLDVDFPDETFRNYVVRDFDINQDGKLSQAEADAVGEIDCSSFELTTGLKGIAFFRNLTSLSCAHCGLAELDVSHNPELEYLWCDGNRLEKLDLSQNPNLKVLICSYSFQLTELDVSKNTKLEYLDCYYNPQMKALDVGQNQKLIHLDCSRTGLEKLDVSQNGFLEELFCVTDSDPGDPQGLTELDVRRNIALKELNCGGNQLTKLDVSKNTALQYLSCGDNQLTELDVRKNTALIYLFCDGNQLTELDVSENTALQYLRCTANQFAAPDLSHNGNLVFLSCGDQKRTVQVRESGDGWQLDMAQLVGMENLGRVSFVSTGLDVESGVVSFPKDALPESVDYEYDCGIISELRPLGPDEESDTKLRVHLTLEKGAEHPGQQPGTSPQQTEEQSEQTETPPQQTESQSGQTGNQQPQTEKQPEQQPQTRPQTQSQTEKQPEQQPQTEKPAHTVHSYGAFSTTKKPTVFAEGVQTRKCKECGQTETKPIPKLKAAMDINATSIKLKTKQSTTKVKVSGLATGDTVQSWKSSNTKVVTVSNKGKITAKSKAGKATITVTLKSGLSKKIKVTVQKKEVACTKVKLDKKTITLKKGKTATLKPAISPITCVQKAKYKSSNTAVATVSSSGKIKAKKKGTATITVTVGQKKVTCKVKVK